MKKLIYAFTMITLLAGCTNGYKPTEQSTQLLAGSINENTARVYITEPLDGATVATTFTIKFGADNVEIVPAGNEEAPKMSGHHHLLIDTTYDSTDPIPKGDPQYKHFGKGQTEATITLEPGTHKLQLLLGDYGHAPHATPVKSEVITIVVE